MAIKTNKAKLESVESWQRAFDTLSASVHEPFAKRLSALSVNALSRSPIRP
jgi:hypothetical protein